ncbi:MAG: response regulator, partial [Planctomycetota bacterium]
QPLLLVVDDDQELCQSLWDLLRERGFRVCLAGDQTSAAQRLARRTYDVVLIDMKLPGGDGREVLRLVQKSNPEARTVVITGYKDELMQAVEQARREGADAVFYKPFDIPKLLQTVDRLTSNGRAR